MADALLASAAATCAEPDSTAEKLREPRVILAGPEPLIEALTWRDVAAGEMPDSDITLLLWLRHMDGSTDWDRGWWDGECWRLAESGGECGGTVLFWSSPEGPTP
jgi:hypothetical protein